MEGGREGGRREGSVCIFTEDKGQELDLHDAFDILKRSSCYQNSKNATNFKPAPGESR